MSLPQLTTDEFTWLNRNGILDFKDFIEKLRDQKILVVDDKTTDELLTPKKFINNKLKKDDDDCIDTKEDT